MRLEFDPRRAAVLADDGAAFARVPAWNAYRLLGHGR